MAHFGDVQNEIYLRGLGGERPELPMTADGLEHAARAVLSGEAFGYIAGGASSERTVAANREAFARWWIAAVDGRAPVLLDSRIRCGADVMLALALGTHAVLLGRPWVYGMALAERGVTHVLRNLLGDLDLTLALAGHTRPEELSAEAVVGVA